MEMVKFLLDITKYPYGRKKNATNKREQFLAAFPWQDLHFLDSCQNPGHFQKSGHPVVCVQLFSWIKEGYVVHSM